MTAPRPFFFGPDGAQLFGWYHPASGPVERECAVLLCPPAGHEYMYSYRAFRYLALQLAELGFPVLRFDYYGTGNSTGDSHGAEQVTEWQISIRIATEELRRHSGCKTIAMIGLRLGATLTEVVATESPVDAMVLWDPCVTGSSYVREVKMLATTSGELSGEPVVNEATGDIEALGFALTPEMVKDLSSIDLTRIVARPAHKILLLHKVGSTGQGRLASQLRAAGADVVECPYTEHETFMVAAIRSLLPKETIRAIQEWLVKTYPAAELVTPRPSPPAEFPTRLCIEASPPFQEEAVLFNDNLFGVVTEPIAAGGVKPARAAVIFLNTGADHHIGPRRMYVKLARSLVHSGFTTLRFDLAGLGDSAPGPSREDNVSYPDSADSDIGAAISYLGKTRGIQQVVLIGMCSGGYHSVHLANLHPEVAGIMAINPALYWKKGDPLDIEYFEQTVQPQQLTRVALSSRHWGRLLRGKISPVRVSREIARQAGVAFRRTTSILDRSDSPSSKFVALLPPRLDIHLVFAGNDLGLLYLQNDLKKLLAILQTRPNFTLSVIAGAGHVFIPLQGQAKLNDTIMTWLLNRYGADSLPGPNYTISGQSRLERAHVQR